MLDEMASTSFESVAVVASSTTPTTSAVLAAGAGQEQNQGQSLPLQQRLPNECLFLIIHHCRHDLVQLHKLLFVNRFFYLAALPYLMHDPIRIWGDRPIDRKKLFTVILVSFFEARVLNRRKRDLSLLGQESEHDDGKDAKLVDAVLRPFGLRVTEDAVKIPSMRRFLIPAATTESISQKQSATKVSTMDDVAEDSDEIETTQLRNDSESEVEEMDLKSWGYPMTVDYSRYLTALSSFHGNHYTLRFLLQGDYRWFGYSWVYHPDDIHDFVATEEDNQQKSDSTSNEMTENGALTAVTAVSPSLDLAEESDDDDDGDDDSDYSWEQLSDGAHLEHAFESLLLHYNFDCITSFNFRMYEATPYLVLAPKMAKLQRLCLSREKNIQDIHVNNTVLFIQQNQAAFPWKPRLDLELSNGWYVPDDNGDDGENPHYFPAPDLAVVEERQLSRTRKQRERFFHYMRCLITLYEAVERPRAIYVGKLPLFYEHSQGIDLDGLLELNDTEMDRIDHGEGPAMEAFFRRCKSLLELNLRVDSHTLFSWAAAEAMHATGSNPSTLGIVAPKPCTSTTSSTGSTLLIHGYPQQSSSTGILKHLQTLKLYTQKPYRFAIHVLNDAMVAFADSLRHVKLECVLPYQNPQMTATVEAALYRNPALMRRARRSLRLYTVPWANTIGDWPRPLPQLQSLTIHLSRIVNVDIGSLDQCSNLGKLEIRYGSVKQGELRPGDINVVIGTDQEETELPSDIESVRQLMDIRYQQADLNFALFPIWNLPKLRVLLLDGLPALRFDFASLETMPSLVELRLSVSKATTALQMVHDSQCTQSEAWAQKRIQRRNTIFKRWSLPALKTVTIQGAPATMFYLDWLKGCPSLENLTLSFAGKRQYLQRRPFFPESETGQKGSNNRKNDHGHDDGTENDTNIEGHRDKEDGNDGDDDDDNTPFWGSQLVKLELHGPWIMSEEDLISLLTIYAPFLESFHVDRLTDSRSLSGYTFLQAFRRADEIHAEYATTRREQVEADTCPETVAGKSDNGMDTRVLGQALTSVQANYTIDERERPVAGLVLIEPEEAVVFKSRRVRVYKMMEEFLVRRSDRECFDLEMGERARTRLN
ncbi:hypothetical protein BGZ99_004403 [Dissophora globulifera]|uniref:Uncharacterized protein n=1 Tax=Dissophora globulifera TaxID=979702 RepID=A0A9P6RM71_9FUNG|nr:hypothetical protein BGZ99_004403 [Dissophora globulifera]